MGEKPDRGVEMWEGRCGEEITGRGRDRPCGVGLSEVASATALEAALSLSRMRSVTPNALRI